MSYDFKYLSSTRQSGNKSVSRLGRAGSKNIAQVTSGQYFRARDPQTLMQIYAEIDELEPVDQDAETYRPVQALFYWPLGLSLLCLLLFY
ncbi:MAG: hypothetical protein CM15mP120_03300 [Pseudomonadota bacterium]|nr:MAG: hypothetical protein CM15mP120_03300 [Pseudomonadota bacterium]